jgi:ATPase subunit of ABC transporter with duplicated ATPase domains
MNTILMSCRNVGKYGTLNYPNFDIYEGDKIWIKGANGKGKSTLLYLILGMLKVDQGNIMKYRFLKIHMMPPVENLPVFMKTMTYVQYFERWKQTKMPSEFYQLFSIPWSLSMQHQSYGNLQKVNILTTLFGQSDIILLDEPFNHLDQKSQMQLQNYLEKTKQTIIITSHLAHQMTSFQTIEL